MSNTIRYTMDMITEALLKLMHEKPFAEISITELVKQAKVGRKSFYRNFSSKEDVLIKRVSAITDDFLENTDLSGSLKENIVIVLNHMKKNDEINRLLYQNNMMYIIENIFIETVVKLHKDLPEDYAYFLAGGYYNLYLYWLKTGCKEDPEELARTVGEHFVKM